MDPSRETRIPVLVVNNDPAVRDMLANLLSGEGFHVALAGSGAEALKIAASAPFDAALVELFLPDYSGVEFKRRLSRVSPKTRVVVLSSFTTIRSTDDVLRFGTSDFILDQREIVELLRAAAADRPAIASPVAEDERLRKCLIDTVDVLVSLLEVNDPFFGGNSHITMEYARFVAEEMKLDRETVDEIVVGSLLHDIGRVGIKSEILAGKREFTESEFKTVRSHCENGAKIIDAVDFPWKVKPIIIHHHERYDGKGYPSGLKGREIPIGARILAVVDAFTAMTAHRPYRSRSLTREEAIHELHKNVGTQFDPEVVELFTSVVGRKYHFRGLGPKPRILMVDDEIDYLVLLKLKLVNEGFDVVAADNAEAALAAMEKDPPDLVVADVMMPGMDGIAMFRRMREANAPWGDTPLIFLSGKERSADQGRRAAAGRRGFPLQAGRHEGAGRADPERHPARREVAEGGAGGHPGRGGGGGPEEPRRPRHRPDPSPGAEDRLRPRHRDGRRGEDLVRERTDPACRDGEPSPGSWPSTRCCAGRRGRSSSRTGSPRSSARSRWTRCS